jgi:hypothetical protein
MISVEYLAGFFDGEGCIGIYRRKGRYLSYRFIVQVTSSNKDAVGKFVEFFHIGHVKKQIRRYRQHAICWKWEVVSNQALLVLEHLEPYLVIKKAEATLAIDFQRNVQKSHYRNTSKEYREDVVGRMKTLKQSYKSWLN